MHDSSKKRPLMLTLAIMLALGGTSAALHATHVEPVVVDGNPTCTDLGYDFGTKVDPPTPGTYAIDAFSSITWTSADGVDFDWTSTLGMDAVIVKGGSEANVYAYDPPAESFGDTGLHSPENSSGHPAAISHLEFCFDYEVTVSKTAATSFTRTYEWDIDKSASPELWNLFTGDSGTSLYTIAVERDFTDSAWAVSGTITIDNDTPFSATITGVTDSMTGDLDADVDCAVNFPYEQASGGTLECTYSRDLPNGTDRTNTATVAASGQVGGGTATAAATFGAPPTEVHAAITVNDSNGGSWNFSDSGSVSYSRTFTCDADEGVHGNTATIFETGQSDSASVSVQCYGLQVTKDADPSLTRTWDWTIEKTADQEDLLLTPGQQFLVNYTVVLSATSSDSDWAAQGTITVVNGNPSRGALINAVADLAGGVSGGVDCGGVVFPHLLGAGGTLTCSYDVDLPSGATVTNTATASLQNFAYAPDGTGTPSGTADFSGTAQVDFSGASVAKVDECVDVTDSLQGALGTVCEDAAPSGFTYSRYVGPFTSPGECGEQQVVNTASFIAGDTAATGEDAWTVNVTVECESGCTLTPGYWKTHSQAGPAPYDDTWAQVGPAQEATPFFLSGQTYYQVLWTAPTGNAYYILAHAYIAATLNTLNGASTPPEVVSAWNEATALFSTYTPAQIGEQKGGQQPRKRFLELAGLLDMYNNGLIGPGHCSE